MTRIKKILLVDDDQDLLFLLQKVLTKHGYHVIVNEDGRDVDRIIAEESPDLVFLDIMLPYRNGWEICREIKKIRQDMPVVFLSILDSPEDMEKSMKVGGIAHIPKPFKYQEILNFIENMQNSGVAN